MCSTGCKADERSEPPLDVKWLRAVESKLKEARQGGIKLDNEGIQKIMDSIPPSSPSEPEEVKEGKAEEEAKINVKCKTCGVILHPTDSIIVIYGQGLLGTHYCKSCGRNQGRGKS